MSETTEYPFGEHVTFSVAPEWPVRFPLTLRIPGWCDAARVVVNGQPMHLEQAARGWVALERLWRSGDTVRLKFPMKLRATVWTKNRNAISIHHGPLTYSLGIGERWQRAGGTDAWPGFEVYPTTPWNYGFSWILRIRRPRSRWCASGVGCARLRIAAFPLIGEGPNARRWEPNRPVILASSASHFQPPTVIADGVVPASSADRQTPRFVFATAGQHFPPQRSLLEWVEYHYPWPRTFHRAEVYWAEDEGVGLECRLPVNWRVQVWTRERFSPAAVRGGYETRKDGFSRVEFTPVETTRIRLRIEVDERAAAGIYEWRVE